MTLQYFRNYARKDPIYVRVIIVVMMYVLLHSPDCGDRQSLRSHRTLATLQTIFANHQSYRDTISRHDGVQNLGNLIELCVSLHPCRTLVLKHLASTIPGKFICVYLNTFIAQM